jgi:predicted Zn-dependent protease
MRYRNLFWLALACGLIVTPARAFDFKLPGTLGDVVETGKLIHDATNTPDAAQEREIGQGVAATLLGAAKLLEDPNVQRYVSRIGLWVALHSHQPSLPWRFAVLDTDAVNAFAAPGGYVFVTKGLLLNLRNEDELAGVLGHEIAHVIQQHHLKALQKDASLKLADKAATRAIGGGGIEKVVLTEVARGTKTLYSRGLDKEDEFEADRLGVVLAARAGYDPYGLPAVLQTLDSLNEKSSGLALLFKTHPRPADRFARLDAAMSGRFEGAPAHPPLRERYLASLAVLTGHVPAQPAAAVVATPPTAAPAPAATPAAPATSPKP